MTTPEHFNSNSSNLPVTRDASFPDQPRAPFTGQVENRSYESIRIGNRLFRLNTIVPPSKPAESHDYDPIYEAFQMIVAGGSIAQDPNETFDKYLRRMLGIYSVVFNASRGGLNSTRITDRTIRIFANMAITSIKGKIEGQYKFLRNIGVDMQKHQSLFEYDPAAIICAENLNQVEDIVDLNFSYISSLASEIESTIASQQFAIRGFISLAQKERKQIENRLLKLHLKIEADDKINEDLRLEYLRDLDLILDDVRKMKVDGQVMRNFFKRFNSSNASTAEQKRLQKAIIDTFARAVERSLKNEPNS